MKKLVLNDVSMYYWHGYVLAIMNKYHHFFFMSSSVQHLIFLDSFCTTNIFNIVELIGLSYNADFILNCWPILTILPLSLKQKFKHLTISLFFVKI